MERIFSPNFSPSRTDPCFCNSGKKFRKCCGSFESNREPPHGVNIKNNVCDAGFCEKIISLADSAAKDWLKTVTVNPKTGTTTAEADKSRVTKGVNLAANQSLLDDFVRSIWLDIVQPEYDTQIEWFERPTLLQYSEGGFYGVHADSDRFDAESKHWERFIDRDLSILIYLNSDFEGGGLTFNRFNYSYAPSAGDLLVFPSDQRYIHTAEKVTAGARYCVVSWAGVVGGLRVSKVPPAGAIKI